MPGLTHPVDPALARALRTAALELRDRRRGRTFPLEVSVGGLHRPERAEFQVSPSEQLDLTLRCELVASLLARVADQREPVAWLLRPGSLTWHDRDAEWWPALDAAYAEAGLPLTAVVVTKTGWYDPRSGLRREWKRLRYRSASRPDPGSLVRTDG